MSYAGDIKELQEHGIFSPNIQFENRPQTNHKKHKTLINFNNLPS